LALVPVLPLVLTVRVLQLVVVERNPALLSGH
jgi:hypothetical protein